MQRKMKVTTSYAPYYPDKLCWEDFKGLEKSYEAKWIEIRDKLSKLDDLVSKLYWSEPLYTALVIESIIAAAYLEGYAKNRIEFALKSFNDKVDFPFDQQELYTFFLNYKSGKLEELKAFDTDEFNSIYKNLYESRYRPYDAHEYFILRNHWLTEIEEFRVEHYTFPDQDYLKELCDDLSEFCKLNKLNSFAASAIATAQLILIDPYRFGTVRMAGLVTPSYLSLKGIKGAKFLHPEVVMAKNRDEFYLQMYLLCREEKWEEWLDYYYKCSKEMLDEWLEKIYDYTCYYTKNFLRCFSKRKLGGSDLLYKVAVTEGIFNIDKFVEAVGKNRFKNISSKLSIFSTYLYEEGLLISDGRKKYRWFIVKKIVESFLGDNVKIDKLNFQ